LLGGDDNLCRSNIRNWGSRKEADATSNTSGLLNLLGEVRRVGNNKFALGNLQKTDINVHPQMNTRQTNKKIKIKIELKNLTSPSERTPTTLPSASVTMPSNGLRSM
jgi:hypothetical protein